VLFSILYLILRGMLRLVPSAGGGREREVEILVLRHQVKVLIEESRPPEAQAVGQGLPFGCGPHAAARAPGKLPRHSGDAPSLAPGTCQTQVDLPKEARRAPADVLARA
jgi:hypothetical protein